MSFASSFTASLEQDIIAIEQYIAALKGGMTQEEAFKATMMEASGTAQLYANSMNTASVSTEGFIKFATMNEVTAQAQNKSFANVRSIINTYNTGLSELGLTQEQFAQSVSQGNATLGKYISSVGVGNAKMSSYIGSLAGAKVATIGMRVATMALNTALSMGISALISSAISFISDIIHREENLIAKSEEAGDAIKSISDKFATSSQTVNKISKRFAELSQGVNHLTGANDSLSNDEYAEFLDLSNQLAEIFPTLSRNYDENGNAIVSLSGDVDTICSSLNTLLETERKISNQKIVDNLPDLYSGIKTKSNNYTEEIKDYKNQKEELQSFVKKLSDDNFENSFDKIIDGNILSIEGEGKSLEELNNITDSYLKTLDELGIKYNYLSTDYNNIDGIDTPKAYYYEIPEWQNLSKEEIQVQKDKIKSGIRDVAETYQDEINNLSQKIASTENENKANWGGLLSSISSWLSTEDLYNSLNDDTQKIVQSMINNIDFSKLNFSKWKDVEEYISNSLIKPIQNASPEIQNEFTKLFSISTSKNSFTEYSKQINDLITEIAKNTDFTEDELKELTGYGQALGNYNDTINNIKKSVSGVTEEQIKALSPDKITKSYDYITKYGLKTWDELESALKNKTFDVVVDFKAEKDGMDNFLTAIEESVSATGMSSDAITNIKSRYQELKNYDASKLFEKTTNGIHLNKKALNELENEYIKTQKTLIDKKFNGLIEQYNSLTMEIENCTEAKEKSDLYKQRDNILQQINDTSELASQYDGLTSAYSKWIEAQSGEEEGNMYDNITNSLKDIKKLYDDGLIGTNAFRTAVQMMTDEDLSTASVEKLISTYKSGYSSMQRYFTESSDGCINFLKDVESINSKWAHMNNDGSWEINFGVGDDEKVAKAISKAKGIKISAEEMQIILRKLSDYGFDINLDSAYSSMEELKIKIDDTEKNLKKLGEKPVNININANDLDAEIEKAKKYIKETKKNSKISLDVKTARLDDTNAKLDILIKKKVEAEQPVFMSVDASSVDDSFTDTLTLLQKYQTAVNNVKTLKLKGADSSSIDSAQEKVNKLAKKIKNLDNDTKVKIGLDADDGIKKIKDKIANNKVTIGVNVDTDDVVKQIGKTNQGLANEISATQSRNGTETSEKIDETKNVNVNVNVNGQEKIDNLKNKLSTLQDKNIQTTAKALGKPEVDSLYASVKRLNSKSIFVIASVLGSKLVNTLKTSIDSLKSKAVSVVANVSGTTAVQKLKISIDNLKSKNISVSTKKKSKSSTKKAGVDGTAYAKGNWGTKNSGVALGGELGQELVVRNGKFFTIGDDSAEFFKYQKNDIIFNAEQTKEILEKGKITHGNRRGNALAEGTAFSGGSGSITSGGKTKSNASSSSSKKKSKTNNSSSNKESSKSKKDDFEETFDWVEVAIDRVERAISSLDLKASSVYKSWSTRNKSLTKEISKVTKEINVQQQGYNKYINQANSVGLSKSWREKVQDGIIDIDTIKNEKLADKIKEYQQWYEKALECKDAVQQLKEQETDLYKQRFDNVVTKYDGILAFNEQKANMLNEQINQTEEKGYIVSGNYYKALIKNEQKGISTLEKERTALINKLNKAVNSGKITVGSEAYNEMAKEINEVSLSIAEANTNIIEYNNSIRDIDWQIFDLMQEKISQISKETEFLIDLISSKKLYDNKGQLTDEGWATMSLYTTNYEIYTQQAKEYAKELSDIDNQLKNDPYNQHLIDRRKELLELQQEMISSAEDEKQAIVDMVEEGIDLELDALKELIDSYTDTLDAQKDLYDYQKKISDQTKDITSLQKQLSAYENDISEEAKSKIQQIKVSLEEAEEGLEEAEYDQYISDQKNLLDDLYDEYEEILNTRLDNVDALLSDMKDAIDNNKDVISEAINKAASSVGYNETDTLKSALTNVSATISSILASISKMVTDSNTSANNSIASTNATITSTPTSSNTVKKGAFGSIPGDSVVQKGDKVKFKKGDLHKTPKKGGGKYENKSDKWRGKELYVMGVNPAIGTDFPYLLGTNADVDKGTQLGWVKKSQISGYSSGIKKILRDELAWTQEGKKAEAIIRPSDGAVLTPLARNDSILNAEATSNLFEFANNPKKFISDNILSDTLKRLSKQDLNVDFTTKYSSDLIPHLSGLADISNILSTIKNQNNNKDLVSMGDININIPIEHVDDYNDFVTQLKQDKQFEDLIHSFSINLLSGSSKHEKDKYIWQ